MINAVSDAFVRRKQPSSDDLLRSYRELRTIASSLRAANRWTDLYRPNAFKKLVLAGQLVARKLHLAVPRNSVRCGHHPFRSAARRGGQIWVDDLKFDIVDASVPTTGRQVQQVDRAAEAVRPRSRQPQNLDFDGHLPVEVIASGQLYDAL